MAGIIFEQGLPFWEQPLGSALATVIVFVGMIFLMFYVTRGKTKEQLRLSMMLEQAEAKFRLLAAQTEEICFLYRPAKDEMLLFKEKPNPDKDGLVEKEECLIKDFKNDAAENAKRHLEDFEDFNSLLEQLSRKESGISQKYLLKRKDVSTTPRYMEVKTDYLSNGGKLEEVVVGTIRVKAEISESEERIDSSSGLLRSDIIKGEIGYALKGAIEGVRFSLLIIRVKNYKQYIENFSRDIPEKIAGRMGACIRSIFRGNDLMGRISEDSYAVLMSHITSREDILKKAEDFEKVLNKVQRESEGGSLEVNIGISIFPMDGETYEDLYEKAVSALNEAHENGEIARCCE